MKYKVLSNSSGDSALYRILENRGIADPYHYLHTTDDDIIDPATIQNVSPAAKLLIQHVAAGDDIFVNVDSDCDGYTSAAFMINWLYKNFPGFTVQHVSWAMHNDKGHGLLMDEILKRKPKLVICPDAGSEEFEKHKQIKENGMDIIIIDHHNASGFSEDAIVINNQLDTGYPTKSLSGVGMVYKFCSYLDKLSGNTYAEDMLDLAALGIIADVMELKDFETRRLINKGLENIENPFLKAMIAKNEYSMGGNVTPTGIAWYVAPSVNAITRIGTQEEKQILFEAMLHHKAYTLVPSIKRGHKPGDMETIVEQSVRTCVNVKKKQDKTRDEMFENIKAKIKQEHLDENKILIVSLKPEEANTSITGLIANKLMSAYGHPVMLLNETFDENGEFVLAGSGRNNPTYGLDSLQQFAEQSGMFYLAQGHDNALGLVIPELHLQDFIKYSNEKLKDYDFSPVYIIDVEFLPNKIDANDILEIADANYIWGQGVDEPLVLLKNVSLVKDNINLFGSSTLKFNLPDNIAVVKFKSNQEEFDSLNPGEGCIVLDIIGTCKRNTGWDNGPEIIVTDYNVVRKMDYYF